MIAGIEAGEGYLGSGFHGRKGGKNSLAVPFIGMVLAVLGNAVEHGRNRLDPLPGQLPRITQVLANQVAGLLPAQIQAPGGGPCRFRQSLDSVEVNRVLGLELGTGGPPLPGCEHLFHDHGEPFEGFRSFSLQRFSAVVHGPETPGEDGETLEGILPLIADEPRVDIAERRVLHPQDPNDVGDSLGEHEGKGAPGGGTVNVDGIFPFRQVPAHQVLPRCFKGHRPARHAMVKLGPLLGTGQDHRAVAIHHRLVFHHLVLIPCDQPVLVPDGRSDAAVRVDGVPRPVAAGIQQVKPTRITHAGHLIAELTRQHPGQFILGSMIAGSSVKQEDPDLVAVRTHWNPGRILGLIDHGTHIPVHPHGPNPKDILLDLERKVGHGQNRL